MGRRPMRQESWKLITDVDGPRRSRVIAVVELWPAWLGWWVVQEFGPVKSRVWRWWGPSAARVYDEAVRVAESWAALCPVTERRTVLPLAANVMGH